MGQRATDGKDSAVSNMPAGHYHAEGDPPDTVRYWDGNQWVGDPIPAPPSTPPPPPGSAAAAPAADTDRFAGLGIRFGAALLDALIVVVAVIIIVAIAFGSSDDDGNFEALASGGEAILIGVIVWALYSVLLVVQLGGTPGKVILGLRITEEDGRTPVTYRSAAMRALPGLLSNVIPVIGSLIALGAAIASIIMISNDPERRSAYDRIGSTRVVRKSAL